MSKHVTDVLFITELPRECIADCSQSGDCSPAAHAWRERLGFTVDRERATKCLRGYGAWDDAELAAKSDDEIAQTVLWLACGDFSEFITHCEREGIDPFGERADSFDPPSGSDIFVLE